METKYTEEAKRLLPCHWDCTGEATATTNAHHRDCPWAYRPAVAAALQAAAEGAEHWKNLFIGQRDELVPRLRAEVERLNVALLRIGERAVVDFDEATVRAVDDAIPNGLKTYGDALKAEYEEAKRLRAENKELTDACLKLRAELDVDKNPGMIGSPVECILQAAADIAKLNNKLPCDHRLVDWDDSYGGCAFCAIQQQAFAYDKLPHEVIECHDKIEELESEVAKRKEPA